jgi:hypothetical protein
MPTNDHIVLNPGTGGATLATDFYPADAGTGVHYQLIQPVFGQDGGAKTLVQDAYPMPVTIKMPANWFVPVGGGTNGGAISVSITGGVTLSVGDIEISGGTLGTILNGVTVGVNTIASGITIGIVGAGGDGISVNQVTDLIGGTIGVQTITIPGGGGITNSGLQIGTTSAPLGAGVHSRTFITGFKIKNIGPNTCFVGASMAAAALQDNGYPLLAYDDLFIEATGPAGIWGQCTTGTAGIRIIGT